MTDTRRELRWGALGASKITDAEVGPAMSRSTRNRLVAVASRRLEAAKSLAGSLGAERAYDCYDDLLNDPDIDAVYNALPNAMHKEWTLAALRAGKHVLCEKPMGLTGDEVREMVAAAREADRNLMEGFMWRFHPRIERVLGLLADGAVGEVRLVRATYTFDLAAAGDVRSGTVDDDLRLNSALGGGALTDLGSYCASGMRTYAGGRPVSLASWRRIAPGRRVETAIGGEVQFDNGIAGQFYAALDVPGGGHAEIIGTGGRIRMANAFRIRAVQAPFLIEIQRADGSWVSESAPFIDQYELELEHFAAVVLDGAPQLITPEDSVANALTLESIRKSWDVGPVEVPS